MEYDAHGPDVVAGRLARLDSGAGSIIWAGGLGFVRVRCLRAEGLWEFTPWAGGEWLWVMVGEADTVGLWRVSYADGVEAPVLIDEVPGVLGPRGALYRAVDFLLNDLGWVAVTE